MRVGETLFLRRALAQATVQRLTLRHLFWESFYQSGLRISRVRPPFDSTRAAQNSRECPQCKDLATSRTAHRCQRAGHDQTVSRNPIRRTMESLSPQMPYQHHPLIWSLLHISPSSAISPVVTRSNIEPPSVCLETRCRQ